MLETLSASSSMGSGPALRFAPLLKDAVAALAGFSKANVGSSLPSRVGLVLEAGFIRIPLSVGGNPAVGLGFLFVDLLSFYHSLMKHGLLGDRPNKRPRVPLLRAAAPDAVYKHK
ncbi:hypothetical protein MRX96_022061 [Rhipicephalus microplus]